MRYLGIDFGSKRIGLAVSSEGIAFPKGVIENDANVLSVLSEIIEKEKIGSIVVGDTRTLSGVPNPVTPEADAFVEQLKEHFPLPVESAFEAMSSIEASRYVEQKSDAAAAAIILQRYLDMRRGALD